IESGRVTVTFNDTKQNFTLRKERWENNSYSIDKTTGKIQKSQLGVFEQYPLRLAWAITIHKSQGLTFDKVIIDAGQSFASGQVYVALSRCTSLDGIVLYSTIQPHSINTDYRIIEFAQREAKYDHLQTLLNTER